MAKFLYISFGLICEEFTKSFDFKQNVVDIRSLVWNKHFSNISKEKTSFFLNLFKMVLFYIFQIIGASKTNISTKLI